MITIWWIVSNHLAHDIVKESPNQMISYHSLCVHFFKFHAIKSDFSPPSYFTGMTPKSIIISYVLQFPAFLRVLRKYFCSKCYHTWNALSEGGFLQYFFTFLARKCFLPLTTCENVFANDAYFCLIDTRKTTTAVLEKFAVNDQSNWKLFSQKL